MALDRIVLIELLVFALLINVVVMLLVLRTRSVPQPVAASPAPTFPAGIASSPSRASVALAAPVLPAPSEAAAVPPPAEVRTSPPNDALDLRQPIDLVSLARASSLSLPTGQDRLLPGAHGRWSERDQESWTSRVRAENARARRYGRPAAIVAIRLEGLDRLAQVAGPEVTRWLMAAVVRNARAGARESDLVQSDELDSIRALLIETDEAGAKTFVERVTSPLIDALQDPRATVRIDARWAAATAGSDLDGSGRPADARSVRTSAAWVHHEVAWRS